MMICNTPVEDGEVRVWFAVMSRTAANGEPTEEERATARAYHEAGLAAFSQDFELWKYKEPAIHILQIPDDGPFHKERLWYRQFYNPRARAPELQARANGIYTTLDLRAGKSVAAA
jgi:3-ketosteroid 9alpha-monooxygenase subunit A